MRILTSDARLSVIQSFIVNAFRRVHFVLLKIMKVIFLSMMLLQCNEAVMMQSVSLASLDPNI